MCTVYFLFDEEAVPYKGDVCIVDREGSCKYVIAGEDMMNYEGAVEHLQAEGFSAAEADNYLKELGIDCVCRSGPWGAEGLTGVRVVMPTRTIDGANLDLALSCTGGYGKNDDTNKGDDDV